MEVIVEWITLHHGEEGLCHNSSFGISFLYSLYLPLFLSHFPFLSQPPMCSPPFYASWCSHSSAAMPHFRDTLQYVVDMNMTNMHVGKMEVTKNGGGSKLPLFVMIATDEGFCSICCRHCQEFKNQVNTYFYWYLQDGE